ncbi:MAG TPA: leucyl aminopeptidase [Actinomycetota bacterium]|nr:leucyl aminopeptidase [Actinomycetota bacterium]
MTTLPQLVSADEGPSSITCDALVVGAYADQGSFQLGRAARDVDADGELSSYLASSGYAGKLGEVAVVPAPDSVAAEAIAVVGLGNRDELRSDVLRRAAGAAVRKLAERSTLGVALHEDVPAGAAAVAEGLLLGSYRFTAHKSDPKPSKIQRISVAGGDAAALERATVVSEATRLARDLVNEPASTLTPTVLADRARAAAEVSDVRCTTWGRDELASRGFGGLLGVSQGSAEEPRFIQLHYAPGGTTRKLALIGKGVTFDSGGLSLKDASNMETMKTDMGGAAAVIGAMSAIGKLKPDVEVIGFIPATENMPSGTAIKPGDVIRHYGGKTTEVLNTDAEGRLILADALSFACEQGPEAIVDVATLTGSIMVALGKKATGVFSNDDALAGEVIGASERAGERFWHMPLYDVYDKELESDVADLKNVGSRWGGAIIAALFLKSFVRESIPWAHLDVAGAARAESDYDEITKGGTGVAVRTLVEWVEGRAT